MAEFQPPALCPPSLPPAGPRACTHLLAWSRRCRATTTTPMVGPEHGENAAGRKQAVVLCHAKQGSSRRLLLHASFGALVWFLMLPQALFDIPLAYWGPTRGPEPLSRLIFANPCCAGSLESRQLPPARLSPLLVMLDAFLCANTLPRPSVCHNT